MRIFLIAGKAGSGKSEFAKLLKEAYEKNKQRTIITEYSKYIKLYAKEMLDWNCYTQEKPRSFLQEMGSFIREDLKMPHLFIDRMQEDILVYERFFENIIISDVRLPEEINAMKKTYNQVIAILIENPFSKPKLTSKQASHMTEHALENYPNFDYIIDVAKTDILQEIIKIMEDQK